MKHGWTYGMYSVRSDGVQCERHVDDHGGGTRVGAYVCVCLDIYGRTERTVRIVCPKKVTCRHHTPIRRPATRATMRASHRAIMVTAHASLASSRAFVADGRRARATNAPRASRGVAFALARAPMSRRECALEAARAQTPGLAMRARAIETRAHASRASVALASTEVRDFGFFLSFTFRSFASARATVRRSWAHERWGRRWGNPEARAVRSAHSHSRLGGNARAWECGEICRARTHSRQRE